jgi:MFS family permease
MKRSKLSLLLRWAQISIFLLFLADTYVYSILDTLLGRYLGTLGITQQAMSLAYAIYGIFQLGGSILLLLLQCLKAVSRISLQLQFLIIILVVAAALGSTLLMVIWPASYPLLLLARALQGSFGAIYTIYAMVLLAKGFPAEWQMQAIAFMTAGKQALSYCANNNPR